MTGTSMATVSKKHGAHPHICIQTSKQTFLRNTQVRRRCPACCDVTCNHGGREGTSGA
jgi:hypothetical protein